MSSQIREELTKKVENRIYYVTDGYKVELSFDKNFIGFKGHFPDKPVLPGLIMIELAKLIAELAEHKKFRIQQIKDAKFKKMVLPDERIICYVKVLAESNKKVLKAKYMRNNETVAKISMEIFDKNEY